MAIRLLKKDEIAQIQSAQRHAEVQEGLKLTRKVDSLRELMAEEEKTLSRFRSESLAALQSEVSKIEKEKESLLSEVRELEAKIAKGTAILDKKKEFLEKKEKDIDEKKEKLAREKELFLIHKIELEKLKKELDKEIVRISGIKDNISLLNKQAHEKNTEATERLEKALLLDEKTTHESLEAKKLFSEKSAALSEREANIEQAELAIAEKEKQLATEKLQLKDQRETLERTMQRIIKTGKA